MRKYPTLPACLLVLALAAFAVAETPAADTCSAAGPQSPRDIDKPEGTNRVTFSPAPPASEMHLCDVHFHRSAEHRARAYSTTAADGQGFVCDGWKRRAAGGGERAAGCGGVGPGDTIEMHWVYTTCEVEPAPELNSCFIEGVCDNPQLRVEAKVFYLMADDGKGALDFAELAAAGPPPAKKAVEYLGSTTGTRFDDRTCSPLQVTWNVQSTCSPLTLASLDAWCADNVFDEKGAHGSRTLVTAPRLLSRIR
jgi:Delta carbonic anhydrase